MGKTVATTLRYGPRRSAEDTVRPPPHPGAPRYKVLLGNGPSPRPIGQMLNRQAEESRSGLTVAGDRARGKHLRAQRGPKPVLPRFGKLHSVRSVRWSAACGQVLSCVRPHCLRHLTRRGPVWRYAGRVQNRPCVLEGTGTDHWFSRPRLVDRLPLPSSDLLAFPTSPDRLLPLRRSAAARGSTRSSSSAPRRCAPSGWPAPPRPACAACAPASGPATGPSCRAAPPSRPSPSRR